MYNDFYEAWCFLYEHPIYQEEIECSDGEIISYSHFESCYKLYVVKVNPSTQAIDDDESKNTKIEFWLESGQYDKDCIWHDIELDCGGDTFEEAIIKLANLVLEWYGNTKDRIKKSNWEIENFY